MTEHVIFNIYLKFSQHKKNLTKVIISYFLYYVPSLMHIFLNIDHYNHSPAAPSLAKKMQTKKDHGTTKQKALKFLFSI